MTWQPISTAPKNWRPALVWDAREAEVFLVEKRASDGSCWLGDWDWQLPNPTHWMPLPAPPDDDDEAVNELRAELDALKARIFAGIEAASCDTQPKAGDVQQAPPTE